MTLERYWLILLKRWRIPVICVVVVGLGAYIGSRLMPPVYQSSVLMRVTINTTVNATDYNNLLASDRLVQTESQLATSNLVLKDVVSRFPGMTVDQLKRATTTSYKLNTQLFGIDVSDINPQRSAALANDIANTLIKQQTEEAQLDSNQLQQQLQREVDSASRSMDVIQKDINDIHVRIANLATVGGAAVQIAVLQARLSGLEDHLNNQQQSYNQWQVMLTQLRLAKTQNSSFLRIAQYAQPATSPVRPQILLNTGLGIVAGLFIGLLLVVLFEQLDTRIRTAEDFGQIINWPLLGAIWEVNGAKEGERIIIKPEQRNINSEQYRILRTNVGFAAVDRPVRSLVVTSVMPSEGKSTVAVNLAIFMARAGKRILLIDADLHHPTVHKHFMLQENIKGFSDAILACYQKQPAVSDSHERHEVDFEFLEPFIHYVETANLSVMPAGSLPPNPSELLDSISMRNLLNILMSSEIDMIIFDTSSLLGLADTRSLVSKVDGTILVTDITQATRKNLHQVKTLLQQSGARVIGCVINKQSSTCGEEPYYYYYDRDSKKEQKSSVDEYEPVLSNTPRIPVGSEARKMAK